MTLRDKIFCRLSPIAFLTGICLLGIGLFFPSTASAAITVEPSTWNIIGLDSNTPAFGPNRFPVGAKVCGGTPGTTTTATLTWDSANPYIDLRLGSKGAPGDPITIKYGSNGCADAFFEVEVQKDSNAYNTTRRFHITAAGISTPTPRELKVERLVSQGRNAISDMQFGTSPSSLTSVPNGGSFNLIVGNTYYIKMVGYTATQGYEQLESFVNFPNTIFQVLSVQSTYSADTSAIVNSPNDKLYADSCGWDNDPNSPSYLSCYSDGKAGGNVAVTYEVKILNVSSSREELGSLIHDFSGSSFHYNSDFSTTARFANIINPNDVTIAKSFAPTPIAAGKTSKMTISISNPTYGPIGGLEFIDIFPISPGGMKVASPLITSNSCGGTLYDSGGGILAANDVGIKLVGGSVPGLSTCLITVDVTTDTVEGNYVNTTQSLLAEGSNTGKTATGTLVIDNNAFPKPKPPSTCGTRVEMARWNFNDAAATPSGPAYSSKHADVASATSAYTGTGTPSIDTADPGTGDSSWIATNGWPVTTTYYSGTPYFQFSIDTSAFGNAQIHYDYRLLGAQDWGPNNYYYLESSTDGATWTTLNASPYTATRGNWQRNLAQTAATTGESTTYFRLKFSGSADKKAPVVKLDNVWFDGCAVVPTDPPTISKAFSPEIVAQGDTSTLTFTISNPNTTTTPPSLPLSGVTVTDIFPAGLTLASTTATNTCGGLITDDTGGALNVGDIGIKLTGGSLAAPAGATPTTCTFSVLVKTPAPDPDPLKNTTLTFANTSRAVAADESGANTGTSGVATATLTSLAAPIIRKSFAPDPIFTSAFGGASTITFAIRNLNAVDALSNVAFSDTFPTSPGNMVVANPPNATTSDCGTPTFAPVAGAGSITFSGGSIAAGGACVVTVDVTSATAGLYTNTTDNVSHTLNGYPASGNSDSDTLLIETASPAISLLKQVGPSSTGPWSSYLAVAPGGTVYYKFTVENLGDLELMPFSVSDPTLAALAPPLNLSSCRWYNGDSTELLAPLTLPIADADNGHIASCILGPTTAIVGTHENNATASGVYAPAPALPVTDTSKATYATTAVTLTKTADKTYYMAVDETILYTYAINNSGANLTGPLTINVTDNKIVSVDCTNALANSIVTATGLPGVRDGNLYTGESAICTASYTVTASDLIAEQITNIARANIKDGGTLNINTPQATATVLAGPDLVVTKTNSVSGNASTNVPFTWTLTAKNTTSLGMTAAIANGQRLLVDNLPPGPTYSVPAVATNTGTTTGTISCSLDIPTGLILTCAATGPVTITPDGGFTVAITATPAAAGTLDNPTGGVCRIDPDGVVAEINNTNNDCADTVTVSTPTITLIKSAAQSYFLAAGNTLNYSYQVRNTGLVSQPGPLSVVDDKIALPATVACPDLSTAGNGDAVFDPGEQVTCTATYTVQAADVTAGFVTNTATATVGGVNSPPVSLTVPIGPDLSAVKTHPASIPIPLVPFDWTLTVTNAATAGYPANFTAGQVILVDNFPAGPSYSSPVSATNIGATTGTINCAVAADTLTCTAGGAVSIPPGSGFSIAVATTALSGGTLSNPKGGGICRVDPTPLVTETNEGNNDCADSLLVGMPSITMLKSVQAYWDPVNGSTNPKAIPGALVVYTLQVSNTGYGPTDAGSVVITDPIPADIELYVGDINGAGSGPVRFIDGSVTATTAPSGLSYSFTGLGDPADKLAFSSNGGASYAYVPTPDAVTGCDPAVTNIKISFGNKTLLPYDIFAGSNGTSHPTFTLLFRARVK